MAPPSPGEGGPPRLHVVVQCRDPLLRGLLADWLDRRPGLVAVAVVRDGGELLFSCGTYRPGLAILEADPVGWSAVRLLDRLREDCRLRSIGLHHSLRRSEVRRLHEAGFDRMVDYAGGLPSLAAAIRRLTPAAEGGADPAVRLTPRESDVLRLLGLGRRCAEIGTALGVRPATVENHKRRVFEKLGVHGETQAVAVALRLGLLGSGPDAGGAAPGPVALTPREREIVALAASGYSVKQTAHTLRISVKTVESIQRHLFCKLGVRGRSGAVAAVYGSEHGAAASAEAAVAVSDMSGTAVSDMAVSGTAGSDMRSSDTPVSDADLSGAHP